MPRFVAGPAAMLLLSAHSPALAGSHVAEMPILVVCDPVKQGPFCTVLQRALSEVWPEREVRKLRRDDLGWRLFFVADEDSSEDLAGHLAWRDAGGAAMRGPDLSLTVMDGAPVASAYRQYAHDLISISQLPF